VGGNQEEEDNGLLVILHDSIALSLFLSVSACLVDDTYLLIFLFLVSHSYSLSLSLSEALFTFLLFLRSSKTLGLLPPSYLEEVDPESFHEEVLDFTYLKLFFPPWRCLLHFNLAASDEQVGKQ
jgi:hypothetical protein